MVEEVEVKAFVSDLRKDLNEDIKIKFESLWHNWAIQNINQVLWKGINAMPWENWFRKCNHRKAGKWKIIPAVLVSVAFIHCAFEIPHASNLSLHSEWLYLWQRLTQITEHLTCKKSYPKRGRNKFSRVENAFKSWTSCQSREISSPLLPVNKHKK